MKKILANTVYSDSTLKKWTKEQLIEQIRILEHNWSCAEESLANSVKNADKIFAEQKAEIERLTEERNKYIIELDDVESANDYANKFLNEYQAKNAELQKQVERLTEENGYLDEGAKQFLADYQKCEIERAELQKQVDKAWFEVGKMCMEERKQTAKEICDLILEHWEKGQFVECDWLRVAISERYGVEVE